MPATSHRMESSPLTQAIHRDDDNTRYVTEVDGTEARIDFRMMGTGLLALMHTEVPTAIANRGVGTALAQFALDDARARGLEVLPFCPFVAALIRRNQEYFPLVSDRFKAKASLRSTASAAGGQEGHRTASVDSVDGGREGHRTASSSGRSPSEGV